MNTQSIRPALTSGALLLLALGAANGQTLTDPR
jgi:hypothetical protein